MEKQTCIKSKVAKASAFSALQSSDESDSEGPTTVTQTPTTTTPPPSCCGDLQTDVDDSNAEWAAAPSRRRARPARPKAVVTDAQPTEPKANNIEDFDSFEADTEWFSRKGQRHAHSKAQKQEWSHKSKVRTAYAQERRGAQRNASKLFAGQVGDD